MYRGGSAPVGRFSLYAYGALGWCPSSDPGRPPARRTPPSRAWSESRADDSNAVEYSEGRGACSEPSPAAKTLEWLAGSLACPSVARLEKRFCMVCERAGVLGVEMESEAARRDDVYMLESL